jgi:phage pi2 protein 07
MQQLTVNLSIPIPDDSVLISKVELEELKRESLSGVYWNMKDLQKRINKSDRWIKDNILYQTRFKRILDSENGGFVYYPKNQGQTWSFQANQMAHFLDKNFNKIFGGETK